MRIGICDNDKSWCECAKNIINNYMKKSGMSINVVIFSDKDTLLNYSGEPLVALFLDIELGEDNGIEVATLVNRKWESCQIVYLTNNLNYATDVYNTAHVYFVLKDEFNKKIRDVFIKIIQSIEQKYKKLVFSLIGGEKLALVPEDILYFERNRRITKITTVWGEFRIWDKMDLVMEMLPNVDFVRCHNSYIVYLPAVLKMDKTSFSMKNGVKISISRGHSNDVEKSLYATKWYGLYRKTIENE